MIKLSFPSLALDNNVPNSRNHDCNQWPQNTTSGVHQEPGIFIDKPLKNHINVNKLTSSLYYHLWNIHKIKGKLDFESAKTIKQALILSKVDYCNSLLLVTTLYQLDKLQCTQNMACQVVLKLRKYDRVTEPMSTLQWLCIQERIKYKVVSVMFNCLKGNAPQHLIHLLTKRNTSGKYDYLQLTSFCQHLTRIIGPSVHHFASARPRIWNYPSAEVHKLDIIEMFMRKLKIHLFTKSYNKKYCYLSLHVICIL